MQAKNLTLENNLAVFQIIINAQELEKGVKKVETDRAKIASDKKAVKGSSVQQIISKYDHAERPAFFQKVLNYLLPQHFFYAVDEFGIAPIDNPQFTIDYIDYNNPSVVTVRVDVMREIKISTIEGLEVEYTPVVVMPDDIQKRISFLRKDNSGNSLNLETITDIKSALEEIAIAQTKENIRKAIFKKIIAENDFNLEDKVIDCQIDYDILQLKNQMGPGNFEGYMSFRHLTIQHVRNQLRAESIFNAKTSVIINAVAKAFNIKPIQEEIEKEICKTADLYRISTADFKNRMNDQPGLLSTIKNKIKIEKTTAFIIKSVVLKPTDPIGTMGN